jgi:hypothetical protein
MADGFRLARLRASSTPSCYGYWSWIPRYYGYNMRGHAGSRCAGSLPTDSQRGAPLTTDVRRLLAALGLSPDAISRSIASEALHI